MNCIQKQAILKLCRKFIIFIFHNFLFFFIIKKRAVFGDFLASVKKAAYQYLLE